MHLIIVLIFGTVQAGGVGAVVDNAKSFIGKTIVVEATRVLQTAAGKMMFAKHGEKTVKRTNQNPKKTQSTANKSRSNHRNSKYRSKADNAESSLVNLANKR